MNSGGATERKDGDRLEHVVFQPRIGLELMCSRQSDTKLHCKEFDSKNQFLLGSLVTLDYNMVLAQTQCKRDGKIKVNFAR